MLSMMPSSSGAEAAADADSIVRRGARKLISRVRAGNVARVERRST